MLKLLSRTGQAFQDAYRFAPFALASVGGPVIVMAVGMSVAAGSPAGGLGAFVAAAVLSLLAGSGSAAMSFRDREPMRNLAFAGIAAGLLPVSLLVLALADFTLPL